MTSEVEADMPDNTLLVVDDDAVVLEIHNILLSTMGYRVLNARDGLEALHVF